MEEIKNNVYYQLGRCEFELEEARRELEEARAFISLIASEIEEVLKNEDRWDAAKRIEDNILQKIKDYD